MRKLSKLFGHCFGGCRVDNESVEEEGEELPIETEDAIGKKASRPPIFPKQNRIDDIVRLETRPHSPFENRLKRLGKKMETEVSKEDCASDVLSRYKSGKARSDGESVCSDGSWRHLRGAHLSTEENLSAAMSLKEENRNKREIRQTIFQSIDSTEAEHYSRQEELIRSNNNFWLYSTGSCASTASLRDFTRTQYLFYEEEEDVVMEFFPSLRIIQQAS